MTASGHFYSALLDRVGYVDGAEVTAEGSFDNDLAHERADAVLDFITLVRHHSHPESLLRRVRSLAGEDA